MKRLAETGRSSSPPRPPTVQFIKKALLREQGALTLVEALRNIPGITMQPGENGNVKSGQLRF